MPSYSLTAGSVPQCISEGLPVNNSLAAQTAQIIRTNLD
jgi:hypothetical protein